MRSSRQISIQSKHPELIFPMKLGFSNDFFFTFAELSDLDHSIILTLFMGMIPI
jgi:hypothetical protein